MRVGVLANMEDLVLPFSVLPLPQYSVSLAVGNNLRYESSFHTHANSFVIMRNTDHPSKKIASITSSWLSVGNIVFNKDFPDAVLKISLTAPANASNHEEVGLAIGHIDEKTKVVIDFRQSGFDLKGIIGNKNFSNVIQKHAIAYLWDKTAKAGENNIDQFLKFPVIGINVLDEELVEILGDNDSL